MDFKMLSYINATRIRHSRIGSGTERTHQADPPARAECSLAVYCVITTEEEYNKGMSPLAEPVALCHLPGKHSRQMHALDGGEHMPLCWER